MSEKYLPITYSIVGVQKAATTTLFSLLARHRQVVRAHRRELHFFDSERRTWSPPDYSGYRLEVTDPKQRIAGDATPSYLFWPRAMERMHAYSPDMRLIASFRDPIDRAFSEWMMGAVRWPETTPDFDEVVRRSPRAGRVTELPEGWDWPDLRRGSAVARGFYGAQLEHALELFPRREQWLWLSFEEVVSDQQALCDRLVAFLGIAPYVRPPQPRQRHQTKAVLDRPAPSPDVVAELAATYADDLALFESLTGVDTTPWTTRRLLAGETTPEEVAERLHRKATAAPRRAAVEGA